MHRVLRLPHPSGKPRLFFRHEAYPDYQMLVFFEAGQAGNLGHSFAGHVPDDIADTIHRDGMAFLAEKAGKKVATLTYDDLATLTL
jgi:hypothetical protein